MRRDERLRFCKICMHRKMDLNQGLICGLTGRPANFEVNCKDFEKDEAQAVKVVKRVYRKQEENKKSSSTWVYVSIALIVLRILFRLMRTRS